LALHIANPSCGKDILLQTFCFTFERVDLKGSSFSKPVLSHQNPAW